MDFSGKLIEVLNIFIFCIIFVFFWKIFILKNCYEFLIFIL